MGAFVEPQNNYKMCNILYRVVEDSVADGKSCWRRVVGCGLRAPLHTVTDKFDAILTVHPR